MPMHRLNRFEGVEMDYTNYRGERSLRTVIPVRYWVGSTEYHPNAQWIMSAYDLDKKAMRDFAMDDIVSWRSRPLPPGTELPELELVQGSIRNPAHWLPAETFSLREYLERQVSWSLQAFGPGPRVGGIVEHITKELVEVQADPKDVSEWVDIVILALDGAWRAGHSVVDILNALDAKQKKNVLRKWPDWRKFTQDQAIEHDRTDE